jgi:hypothetical protein
MSAKFVWGVVAIVVGIIGIFSGVDQIVTVIHLDEVVKGVEKLFNSPLGKYSDFAFNGKLGGVIKILGGLCLCIFGTWLIQEAHYEDKLERRKLSGRENGTLSVEDPEPLPFVAPESVSPMKRAKGPADFRLSSAEDDLIETSSEAEEEQIDAEVCPDCGAKMVVKKVSRGPHAGRAFWACVKYPQCKSIVPIRSEVAAQMEF